MTLSLFADCALAGCSNPTDEPGAPCPECTAMFDGSDAACGWSIQRSTSVVVETADQVLDRKTAARVAQALATEPERKPNQTCWLCEDRRTCTRQPAGWECDTCRSIT